MLRARLRQSGIESFGSHTQGSPTAGPPWAVIFVLPALRSTASWLLLLLLDEQSIPLLAHTSAWNDKLGFVVSASRMLRARLRQSGIEIFWLGYPGLPNSRSALGCHLSCLRH